MENNLRMYILVKKSIPLGVGIVSVAHAPVMLMQKYRDDELLKEWLETSFRKVVCWVSDEEFEKYKNMDRSIIVSESKFDDKETAIALCPRKEWPKAFHYFMLMGKEKKIAG